MSIEKKIGEKVLKLRKDSGITQKLLANYLDIDQSYISKIEKGERQLSLDSLTKLSSLFGCSIEHFIEDDADHLPMAIAFRADGLSSEDLKIIAIMNRIALKGKNSDTKTSI